MKAATILTSGNRIKRAPDSFDVTYDFDPERCYAFQIQANSGGISQQSRMAQEILEKDTDIRQAWGTRVASLLGLRWKVTGADAIAAAAAAEMLRNIQPDPASGMIGFWELLQSLQSANLHGFAIAQIAWAPGGGDIEGFIPVTQSSCRVDLSRDLPLMQDDDGKEIAPSGPGWIYHRVGDRAVSVCRVGLVRPLSWLFVFKRPVLCNNVRFLEKFGMPILKGQLPGIATDAAAGENDEINNPVRKAFEEAFENMGAEGWILTPSDCPVELVQPTFPSSNQYQDFLSFASKQAFRLILGQDSTSSAENGSRSTAEVHDLVRRDILVADALAVQQTATQLLRKWAVMKYGKPLDLSFEFELKPELAAGVKPQLLKAANENGFAITAEDASAFFGFRVVVAEKSTASLAAQIGVGGVQSFVAICADPLLSPEQKAGLLSLLFKISEEEARKALGTSQDKPKQEDAPA